MKCIDIDTHIYILRLAITSMLKLVVSNCVVVGVHLSLNFVAYIMYTYVACDSKSCRITMMHYVTQWDITVEVIVI